MIFITRDQTSILIPKHINCADPLKLTLTHNLTNTEYVFENIPNNDTTLLFWTLTNLDFSALPTGEYKYDLNGIETGLLQICTDVTTPISYNTEKTIVQYGS